MIQFSFLNYLKSCTVPYYETTVFKISRFVMKDICGISRGDLALGGSENGVHIIRNDLWSISHSLSMLQASNLRRFQDLHFSRVSIQKATFLLLLSSLLELWLNTIHEATEYIIESTVDVFFPSSGNPRILPS